MIRLRRLATLMTLSAVLCWGGAQTVTEGTEVLMTDPMSSVIVGHGVVTGGTLELTLNQNVGTFVALFIRPDNSVEQYQGEVLPDGSLSLIGQDGVNLSLDELLARSDLNLSLSAPVPTFLSPEQKNPANGP